MSGNGPVDPNEGRRLDEVSIFKGKLTFLIPHEWVENEDDSGEDYCSYCASGAMSGFFRVSLITSRSPDPEAGLETFFQCPEFKVVQNTGNRYVYLSKQVEQNGEPLEIHYWKVANRVSPDLFCEAVFSYTALASMSNHPDTLRDVALLSFLLPNVRFG